MIGHISGRLTVTGFSHKKGSHSYWSCTCSCGTIWTTRQDALRAGKVRSCGCLARETASKLASKYQQGRPAPNRLPNKAGLYRELRRRYINNARKRGREFTIPEADFIKLTSADCYYCKQSPQSVFHIRKTIEYSLLYNGIDRVDNSGHYSADNVVTCCAQCNYAKREQTQEEFIAWAKRIASATSS